MCPCTGRSGRASLTNLNVTLPLVQARQAAHTNGSRVRWDDAAKLLRDLSRSPPSCLGEELFHGAWRGRVVGIGRLPEASEDVGAQVGVAPLDEGDQERGSFVLRERRQPAFELARAWLPGVRAARRRRNEEIRIDAEKVDHRLEWRRQGAESRRARWLLIGVAELAVLRTEQPAEVQSTAIAGSDVGPRGRSAARWPGPSSSSIQSAPSSSEQRSITTCSPLARIAAARPTQ